MVYRYIKPKFAHNASRRGGGTQYIVNDLDKTFSDKVYPRIPFLIREKPYRIKVHSQFGNNPSGQLYGLALNVTTLVREERVVLTYNKATELRPHVERLIVEAMQNGDRHKPTMTLANFWLVDKALIHKLFKELVPRYQNYPSSFTAIHSLGINYDNFSRTMTDVRKNGSKTADARRGYCVLELRGNDLPPIVRPQIQRSELLTNVLLSGARESRAFETKAAIEAATRVAPPAVDAETPREEV